MSAIIPIHTNQYRHLREAYQLSLLVNLLNRSAALLLGTNAVVDTTCAHQHQGLARDDRKNLPRLAACEQAVLELLRGGGDSGNVSLKLLVVLGLLLLLDPDLDVANVGGGNILESLLQVHHVLLVLDSILPAADIHDHVRIIFDSLERDASGRLGPVRHRTSCIVVVISVGLIGQVVVLSTSSCRGRERMVGRSTRARVGGSRSSGSRARKGKDSGVGSNGLASSRASRRSHLLLLKLSTRDRKKRQR